MFLFEPVKSNCATGCVADAVVPVNFIDNCIAWMRRYALAGQLVQAMRSVFFAEKKLTC